MKWCGIVQSGWIVGLSIVLWVGEPAAAAVGFRIDGFSWQGDAIPGGVVELSNPFGDIRSRASEDGNIHFQAVIQKFTPQHDRFTFDINRQDSVLRITPRFPDELSLGKARVDITLLLPPGTQLNARTTSGLIKVDRFRSEMVLRSESGRIKIASALPVDIESVSGDISARLTGQVWERSSRLKTANGQIGVIVAEDAQGKVEITTDGGVAWLRSANGVAELLKFGKSGLMALRGDGGGLLQVLSDSGDVSFEDRPYPRPPSIEPMEAISSN